MKRFLISELLALVALCGFVACNEDPESINNAPEVYVDEATDLLRTSAVLTGRIMAPAKASLTEYGFKVSSTSDFSSADTRVLPMEDGLAEFSTQLVDLEVGGTYFYVSYATNGLDEMTSTLKTFTTPQRSGVLLTDLRLADETTFRFEARVGDDGGGEINGVGFCWGTTEKPTIFTGENKFSTLEGDNFTESLPLERGKVYYVRAFADSDITGDGTSTISYSQPLRVELAAEAETRWGLSGSMNNWGDSWFEWSSEQENFVLTDVAIAAGDEFRIRANSSWENQFGITSESGDNEVSINELITLTKDEGGNTMTMCVSEADTYDLYFHPDRKVLWVMTAGYKPGEEVPSEPLQQVGWYLEGMLQRDVDSHDFLFDEERQLFVAQDVELAAGDYFKIYSKQDSAINYGYALITRVTHSMVDAAVPIELDGGDVEPTDEGRFDLWLDIERKLLYVMSDGKTPEQADNYEPKEEPEINPEHCKIYYTTANNYVLGLQSADAFGVKLLSNEYNNGQGVLTFDGPVTTIGDRAFYLCGTMTSIVLPESVTSIGKFAFMDCTNLPTVTIPESVVSIGEGAFSRCDNLAEFRGAFASKDGRCLVVERVLNSFAPKELTEYSVAEGVVKIGNSAFENCTLIERIHLPQSVTEIDDDAFASCMSLAELDIPAQVTRIGDNAFNNCGMIKTLTLPETLASIGSQAFIGCAWLETLYCYPADPPTATSSYTGSEITGKGEWLAFEFVPNTARIYVPELSVTTYKAAAGWSDYAGLIYPMASEEVPSTWKIYYTSTDGNIVEPQTAGDSATGSSFGFGANVISNSYENGQGVITLDGEAQYVGSQAFAGKTTLRNITLPNTVTEIMARAFDGCSGLEQFELPEKVWRVTASAFRGCTALKSVQFNNSLQIIGLNAFDGCTQLDGVTIPDGVTSIDGAAFQNCSSITTITIPEGVASIGGNAFYGCGTLATVYCSSPIPPSGGYQMFDDNASDRKIYVPNESVDTYKNATYWSDYADAIYPMDGSDEVTGSGTFGYAGSLVNSYTIGAEAATHVGLGYWYAQSYDPTTDQTTILEANLYPQFYEKVTFEVDVDWLTVGYGENETWWYYDVEANTTGSSRTATVTATFYDVEGYVLEAASKTKQITITQQAGSSGVIDADAYLSDAAFVCTTDDTTNRAYTLGDQTTVDGYYATGVKLGTSSRTGLFTSAAVGVTGSKTLSFYAVAWSGKSATLYVRVDGVEVAALALQSNDGAANNPPYTITTSAADYYTVALTGLTASSVVEFSTSPDYISEDGTGTTRAIVFGAKLN